jgi:hypothetical protein
MYLLARNEAINAWLEEHPAVLGGMFIVLGLVLLSFGLKTLFTGRSRSKRGQEIEGPMAYLQGAMLTIFGAGCLAFAIFRLWSAFA